MSNTLEQSGKGADQSFSSSEPGTTTQECPSEEKSNAWVEIKILSASGEPVANEAYIIELKDGTQLEGKTDGSGVAREEGLDKGPCKLILPNRDKSSIKT